MRHHRFHLALIAVAAACSAPLIAQTSAPTDHPLLPRDLEIELALSAAPKHLRDGAAVLVLEQTGYVTARAGTNAFTCIVNRRGGDLFPVCWDAEGTRTVLSVDVDAVKQRLDGAANVEIERRVAEAYKSGRYKAPTRSGVAYMLSPLRYRIDEQGHVTRTPSNPHLMFYGPGLSDSDIGGQRGSFVFMNRVGPDGMMIVPVGASERDAILNESKSLTERVEKQIGFAR
jgi:hypothetical protein